MSIQTVFKAGNSNVVSIPSAILSDLKIKTGDKVIIEKYNNDSINIKKASTKNNKLKSQTHFNNWYKTFIDQNGEILDELADR